MLKYAYATPTNTKQKRTHKGIFESGQKEKKNYFQVAFRKNEKGLKKQKNLRATKAGEA